MVAANHAHRVAGSKFAKAEGFAQVRAQLSRRCLLSGRPWMLRELI
jgi:hypothetical protein